MLEENKSIEEVKRESIMEKVDMTKIILGDKEIDPFIIITMKDGKVEVYLNKKKVYRTLHHKNKIENALDIFLVDNIKELLLNLAMREEKAEELNQKEEK